jgi:hypothetical protein
MYILMTVSGLKGATGVYRENGGVSLFLSLEVIRAYRSALTDKCVSPELPDEISRVVPEPIRYGVCAALLSRIPGDEQSQRIAALLQKEGASCLEQLVGAPIPSPVLARIEALLPVVREGFAKRP